LYDLITVAEADLTFLYGESLPRCTHRIDKHFHGYFTVQYMSAGSVELSIEGDRHALTGRWFWSAYPGPRIAFHPAPPTKTWRHRYLAFRGPRVRRWMDAGLFPVAPQPAPGDRDFGGEFDRLLDLAIRRGGGGAGTAGDAFAAMRAAHVLEELLIELAEDRAAAHGRPAWLRAAIAKLDAAARGEAGVHYQRVAADLGMAQVTFRRKFRAATGAPPHEYVLQSRVAEARRLLGETDLPIKSIARQLGYSDVYFFSRQFRKFAGVPPALFRRSRQG
jgi:AraC-like DNA-binding protein